MKAVIFILFAAFASAQQAPYDLILKGGHVIDPKNGVDAISDVAIRNGKIAAVGKPLPDCREENHRRRWPVCHARSG